MKKNDMPRTLVESNGANFGALVAHNMGTININNSNKVKIPSLIGKVVKALANLDINEENADNISLDAFKPDDKLDYNNVIKYREIIKENAIYYTYCNELLDISDDSNIGMKSKILKCVRNWYLDARGELILTLIEREGSEIEKIRKHADLLIDSVKQKIYDISYNSISENDTCAEDIELGTICFTCFCFMECKILERPQ